MPRKHASAKQDARHAESVGVHIVRIEIHALLGAAEASQAREKEIVDRVKADEAGEARPAEDNPYGVPARTPEEYEEVLRQNVPSPDEGDAYGIGTADPYDIYVFDGVEKDWKNNGKIQTIV